MPDAHLTDRLRETLAFRQADMAAVEAAGVDLTQSDALGRLAVAFSDGVIEGEQGKQSVLLDLARQMQKPVLERPADEELASAYQNFFASLF